MNKAERSKVFDELRSEYQREDFGPMTRGKYAAALAAASNVVVLRPEVAQAFPNAEAVNQALMGLIELARTSTRSPARRSRAKAGGTESR